MTGMPYLCPPLEREGVAVRMVVIVLLLCVWLYFAYDAFRAGNVMFGFLLLLVGAALTIYRLRRR